MPGRRTGAATASSDSVRIAVGRTGLRGRGAPNTGGETGLPEAMPGSAVALFPGAHGFLAAGEAVSVLAVSTVQRFTGAAGVGVPCAGAGGVHLLAAEDGVLAGLFLAGSSMLGEAAPPAASRSCASRSRCCTIERPRSRVMLALGVFSADVGTGVEKAGDGLGDGELRPFESSNEVCRMGEATLTGEVSTGARSGEGARCVGARTGESGRWTGASLSELARVGDGPLAMSLSGEGARPAGTAGLRSGDVCAPDSALALRGRPAVAAQSGPVDFAAGAS
jgi:hypothetical protein